MRKYLFFILLICLFPVSAYCDDRNIYINDKTDPLEDGSQEHPYDSFSDINWTTGGSNSITDWITAGDKVFINLNKGAIWHERLNIQVSGASGRPITVQSYGLGSAPIIYETVVTVAGWTDDGDGTYQKGGILEFVGVTEDNILIAKATDSTLTDGYHFYDDVGHILHYKPTIGVATDHSVRYIDNYSLGAVYTRDSSYITIKDLDLRNCRRCIYASPGGIPINNIILQDNKITNAKYGIAIYARNGESQKGHVISGNTIIKCGESIIVGSWGSGPEKHYDVTIKNNTIIDTGFYYGSTLYLGDKEGIGLQNVNNSTISGNTISGHTFHSAIVLWVAKGSTGNNNIFSSNYIHDIDGCGIVIGTQGSNDATGNLIAYNIVVNVGNGPNPPYGGLRINRSQNPQNKWYNNLLVENDINISLNSLPNYHIIKNNISLSPRNYHIRSIGAMNNNVVDYNLYYSETGTLFGLYAQRYTYNEWKTETGQDEHSVSGLDPLVNADFTLNSISPAIDAGEDVGLDRDYRNKPVPRGIRPDIGASEYQTLDPPANLRIFK